MKEYYKSKETGKVEEIKEIKKNYRELLGTTNEFEEYRNNFSKFLKDYYVIIREFG